MAFDTTTQPRRAASIAAMSIFFLVIIASNARLAAARAGSVIACVKAADVICRDTPHLSLHQPHALSCPRLSSNRSFSVAASTTGKTRSLSKRRPRSTLKRGVMLLAR